MSDFDRDINRIPFDCVKWSYVKNYCGETENDVIPMWIADMDFACPKAIVSAVEKRAAHPVYGYAGKPDEYFEAFIKWMKKRHGCAVSRDWIHFSPGIVPAIAIAIKAFSEKGDGVCIMPPVYHPFKSLIEKNGRRTVEAPLLEKNMRYELDFTALEKAMAESRLLLLCSPHNPGGRLWSKDELARIGQLAKKHDVLVLADEIHADLVFKPGKHIPSLEVPELAGNLIACMAPSKTFNIAGLQISYIVIPDGEIRRRYALESDASGLGSPNCMGVAAAVAAYEEGEAWLDEALDYINTNYEYLRDELARSIPEIKVWPIESTFLAWLDFRGLGLDGDVHQVLLDRAGLWLDAGSRFGTGGDGFARLNLGCTRATLQKAIGRLEKAFR